MRKLLERMRQLLWQRKQLLESTKRRLESAKQLLERISNDEDMRRRLDGDAELAPGLDRLLKQFSDELDAEEAFPDEYIKRLLTELAGLAEFNDGRTKRLREGLAELDDDREYIKRLLAELDAEFAIYCLTDRLRELLEGRKRSFELKEKTFGMIAKISPELDAYFDDITDAGIKRLLAELAVLDDGRYWKQFSDELDDDDRQYIGRLMTEYIRDE